MCALDQAGVELGQMRAHFVLSAKTADNGEIVGFLRPQANAGHHRTPARNASPRAASGSRNCLIIGRGNSGDRSLTTTDVRAAGPFPRRRFETRWNPPRSNPG